MPTGTVKWFDATKGYGFIQPDQGADQQQRRFVHISAAEQVGVRGLDEGQKVEYEKKADSRSGKSSAVDIREHEVIGAEP